MRQGDGLRKFTHCAQPLSERGSELDMTVGEQQALGNVVSNPMSLPSQKQLLGTQAEMPMQGMKILGGSSPKQSAVLWLSWRGRKRRAQEAGAAFQCLLPGQISSRLVPGARCPHKDTHTHRLMHTDMEVYTKLCSHVHSHKHSCSQKHTREEHTQEHNQA